MALDSVSNSLMSVERLPLTQTSFGSSLLLIVSAERLSTEYSMETFTRGPFVLGLRETMWDHASVHV